MVIVTCLINYTFDLISPHCRVQLDINQWRLITLLYRRKTNAEMQQRGKKGKWQKTSFGKSPGPGDYADDAYGFTNDDTPYEFVAVYSSFAALMVSVKAWACRRLTGHVQLGMDNMYNMLKDCPHVRYACSRFPGFKAVELTPQYLFVPDVPFELWCL